MFYYDCQWVVIFGKEFEIGLTDLILKIKASFNA